MGGLPWQKGKAGERTVFEKIYEEGIGHTHRPQMTRGQVFRRILPTFCCVIPFGFVVVSFSKWRVRHQGEVSSPLAITEEGSSSAPQ